MAYPLPAFYFRVEVAGLSAEFSEVTGLNYENQPIEYRHGNSPEPSTIKMPGLVKYGNITLKKGVFKGDNNFFDWVKTIKMSTVERQDMLISLLDETQAPVMQWEVRQAWPTKITSPDMKANGNEVAIETLEIAHEGLDIRND